MRKSVARAAGQRFSYHDTRLGPRIDCLQRGDASRNYDITGDLSIDKMELIAVVPNIHASRTNRVRPRVVLSTAGDRWPANILILLAVRQRGRCRHGH